MHNITQTYFMFQSLWFSEFENIGVEKRRKELRLARRGKYILFSFFFLNYNIFTLFLIFPPYNPSHITFIVLFSNQWYLYSLIIECTYVHILYSVQAICICFKADVWYGVTNCQTLSWKRWFLLPSVVVGCDSFTRVQSSWEFPIHFGVFIDCISLIFKISRNELS